MYRSHKIYLTIGLLLATCLAGCRDSLRSKRQRILDTFSHVSLASENERMSASRYCEEACTGIGMLGECERKEMLGILADRFLDIRFDEKSYGNRIVSIDAYVALVPSISGKRWDSAIADGLHQTENALATHVPVWHLDCLPDEEAATLCSGTIMNDKER